MSSPTTGIFFSVNFCAHSLLEAMNAGMQFTKAVFVSRHTCAQNCVAFSEPTGKYDTMISVPVCFKISLISFSNSSIFFPL